MGTVRQRKAAKNTNKNTRRIADRHRKRVTIHVSALSWCRSALDICRSSRFEIRDSRSNCQFYVHRVILLSRLIGTKS